MILYNVAQAAILLGYVFVAASRPLFEGVVLGFMFAKPLCAFVNEAHSMSLRSARASSDRTALVREADTYKLSLQVKSLDSESGLREILDRVQHPHAIWWDTLYTLTIVAVYVARL
jgi:hypothetical protein